MKKFLQDFKQFAMKGNVIDMAVGVIIGAAFGKIVTSLVNDIIMPAIGYISGGVNFSEYKFVLKEAVKNGQEVITPEVAVNWGTFIQTIVDFLIIAFCIFVAIKAVMRLQRAKKEEEATPAGPTAEQLLTDIRDLLKKETEGKK